MDELDIKREKIIKHAKYGGLAVVLLLFAPLLFGLAAFAFGTLVAAGATLLGGIALVNFLPVFSMKMANWRLGALKTEARKNPIETLDNQLIEMASQLDAYKADTKSFIAAATALEDDIKEMAKDDPEGAAEYSEILRANAAQIKMRGAAIKEAVDNIEEAKIKVDKVRRRWNLEQKHSAMLKPTEKSAALNKILSDEAIDEVMKVANRSTANLIVETMAAEGRQEFKAARKSKAQAYQAERLENTPSDVLDVKVEKAPVLIGSFQPRASAKPGEH